MNSTSEPMVTPRFDYIYLPPRFRSRSGEDFPSGPSGYHSNTFYDEDSLRINFATDVLWLYINNFPLSKEFLITLSCFNN